MTKIKLDLTTIIYVKWYHISKLGCPAKSSHVKYLNRGKQQMLHSNIRKISWITSHSVAFKHSIAYTVTILGNY